MILCRYAKPTHGKIKEQPTENVPTSEIMYPKSLQAYQF